MKKRRLNPKEKEKSESMMSARNSGLRRRNYCSVVSATAVVVALCVRAVVATAAVVVVP